MRSGFWQAGAGWLEPVCSTKSPTKTPSHSKEQSSLPHARLCVSQASGQAEGSVLKLCRNQGKSVLGQSLYSYPSGSFQLCVGSMSTFLVQEILELGKGQSSLYPAWVIGKNSQRLYFYKRKRNCSSLIVVGVKGPHLPNVQGVSHPGGKGNYPHCRKWGAELAKVTQQIVKLGDCSLSKAKGLFTTY